MPRKNRREIFNPRVSSCNHCTARCVRKLCLLQSEDGLNRRKVMIQQRLMFLKEHFAIEIFAFAILDNHIHLLLRNQPEKVDQMSDREVARHWLCMFPGSTKKKNRVKKVHDEKRLAPLGASPLVASGEPISALEPPSEAIDALVARSVEIQKLRVRLSDISWLMRAFCQHVATICNREDNVTGRFWQGRYHMQNILDEESILACAIYIDLNPIRARIASTLEDSLFTSALLRIRALKAATNLSSATDSDCSNPNTSQISQRSEAAKSSLPPDWFLAPVMLTTVSQNEADCKSIKPTIKHQGFLNLNVLEYLKLLEYVGSQNHPEKRGFIAAEAESIFKKLNINPDHLEKVLDPTLKVFKRGTRVALSELVVA